MRAGNLRRYTAVFVLRLRCAEMCCVLHTAPEQMPDSLLGGYALADDTNGIHSRVELAVKASRANIVVSDEDRLNGMGN